MDITDPDVQEELDAMTSAVNPSIFGGSNRFGISTQNRCELRQMAKPSTRPTTFFSIENTPVSSDPMLPPDQLNRSLSPPPPVVLSNSDPATKFEQESLLKKPALTPEEKFLVLDARDKLIRLTTKRNVDIKKAASIKGVCPDMCPEKERLSRLFDSAIVITCWEHEFQRFHFLYGF